jgi:hypothetical protein
LTSHRRRLDPPTFRLGQAEVRAVAQVRSYFNVFAPGSLANHGLGIALPFNVGSGCRDPTFEVRAVLGKYKGRSKRRDGVEHAKHLVLVIGYQDGCRHLPLVSRKRAA